MKHETNEKPVSVFVPLNTNRIKVEGSSLHFSIFLLSRQVMCFHDENILHVRV